MHWAEQQFQQSRSRLLAIAYRLLGSAAEAEDAVQEAWLRLSCAGGPTISNLEAWLTTVVANIGLDMLRSRAIRKEEALDGIQGAVQNSVVSDSSNPEQEALSAESVGLALLVVLDRLTPAERVSFVMHDIFALSFEELAPMLGRTPVAVRQLASRARRRVLGQPRPPSAGFVEKRSLVKAFLDALRAGDLDGLVAVLDPNLVVNIDKSAAIAGQPRVLRGAATWAKQAISISRGARFTEPAWVGDDLGVLVAPAGKLLRVLRLRFETDRVSAIEVIADPDRLARLGLFVLDAPGRMGLAGPQGCAGSSQLVRGGSS